MSPSFSHLIMYLSTLLATAIIMGSMTTITANRTEVKAIVIVAFAVTMDFNIFLLISSRMTSSWIIGVKPKDSERVETVATILPLALGSFASVLVSSILAVLWLMACIIYAGVIEGLKWETGSVVKAPLVFLLVLSVMEWMCTVYTTVQCFRARKDQGVSLPLEDQE